MEEGKRVRWRKEKGRKRVRTDKKAKKMVRWERKKEGTREDRAWEGR